MKNPTITKPKPAEISEITLFGISNCSTVIKARKWLEANGIEYIFWDYKKQGIDESHLEKWCGEFGWGKVLNRSGMMWRKASDEDKSKVVNQKAAIEFMLKVPTSIKRPIVEMGQSLLIGFDEDNYAKGFKTNT